GADDARPLRTPDRRRHPRCPDPGLRGRAASVAERLPADVPELRDRGPQLGVPAEAREARLVREPLPEEVQMLLRRLPRRRLAHVEAACDAALPAMHVHPHGAQAVVRTAGRPVSPSSAANTPCTRSVSTSTPSRAKSA